VFLWVTPTIKSTKFGSRYLGEGSSERDESLHVARAGLGYQLPRPVTFGPGDNLWSQNIEECKNCNVFLQGGFTNLNEISHDGGFVFKQFW